jgi:hypothetical protein
MLEEIDMTIGASDPALDDLDLICPLMMPRHKAEAAKKHT